MPTSFVPLLGPQGVYTDNDHSGQTADYPSYINGYFEKTDSQVENRKFAFTKRQGIGLKWDSTTPFTNNHKIQGVISSVDRTSVILYSNNGSANTTWYMPSTGVPVSRGTAPAAAGNWTYTNPVAFCALDGISYGANVYYCATDFTKGAVIDSSGNWTEITDTDFTGLNKCTNLIGIGGYLYIGTTNNRIYNSDLNAATTWSALSFLTAAHTPGRLMWLARIRNFLIVFKDKSIEFFEDVGNPTPGSPLEPRVSLNSRIGLLHRNTVKEVSDGIIFAGTTETGMSKMYKISHTDMSIKPISDRLIEQFLPYLQIATTTFDYSVCAVASASFKGQSQVFYMDGKEFYSVNIPGLRTAAGNYLTCVYDNTLGFWTQWATHFGSAGTEDTYGFHASQAVPIIAGSINTTLFVDNTPSGVNTPPRTFAPDPSNPLWYDKDSDGTTQNYYSFAWTSDQFDLGSRKRKFCDAIEIHYTGDSSATPSNSPATTLTFRYRDYDFNITSGYWVARTMYYDPAGGVRCRTTRLGQFRKRSINIILNAITPMKIWAVEVTYNQGETDQES